MSVRGGGVYETAEAARSAAVVAHYFPIRHGTVPPREGVDFGVYPANSNPKVWVWEMPPRPVKE